MVEHLGYEKHQSKGNGSGNSRNGRSAKRIKGDHVAIQICAPVPAADNFSGAASFQEWLSVYQELRNRVADALRCIGSKSIYRVNAVGAATIASVRNQTQAQWS